MSLMFSSTVMSQDISVEEMLSWQDDVIAGKYDDIRRKMQLTFKGKIDNDAPDSIKYYYYAINAAIEKNPSKEKVFIQEAINLRENKIGVLDPDYIELLWAMGNYYESSNLDSAMIYYQKGIIIGETILENPQLTHNVNETYLFNIYGMTLGDLGNIYKAKGMDEEAIQLLNEAYNYTSYEKLRFDRKSYIYKIDLADLYLKRGEKEKADKAINDIINLMRTRAKESGDIISFLKEKGCIGDYILLLQQIAGNLDNNGKYQEAVNYYEEAAKAYTALNQTSDGNGAYLYNGLGMAYLKQDLYNKALENFLKAKDLATADTPIMAVVLHNIGRAYMLLNKKNEAKQFLQESKTLQMKVNYSIPNTEKYLNEIEK